MVVSANVQAEVAHQDADVVKWSIFQAHPKGTVGGQVGLGCFVIVVVVIG